MRKMLGVADRSKILELLKFIFDGNQKKSITSLRQMIDEGIDVVNLKNDIRKNRIKALVIFLLIMLIAQSILLVPSYYAGWIRADNYYDSKLYFVN